MEPVTHILTGACLARTGFNRKVAYATLAMAIGAEFPDIDTLSSLRGPVEGFAHHRGITHTFVALPFEAVIIVAAVYGLHRWRISRAARAQQATSVTIAPVRWGALYGFVLIALLSHLLLDYTNNYGLRPFAPFNDHWYAASIVFIFDPLIFGVLLAALVLPAVFGLVGAEVGAPAEKFRGRGWAIAALVLIVALWGTRGVQHATAVQLAMQQSVSTPAPTAAPLIAAESTLAPTTNTLLLTPQRVFVSPDPFNLFRWHAATDFGPVYQLADVDTRRGLVSPNDELLAKQPVTPAILAADRSALGRVYLDWSMMPLVDADTPSEPGEPTVVTFRDLRFMTPLPFFSSDRVPLTGAVEVDAQGHVLSQSLDGRTER